MPSAAGKGTADAYFSLPLSQRQSQKPVPPSPQLPARRRLRTAIYYSGQPTAALGAWEASTLAQDSHAAG